MGLTLSFANTKIFISNVNIIKHIMNIINSVAALLLISPEEYIPRVFRRDGTFPSPHTTNAYWDSLSSQTRVVEAIG